MKQLLERAIKALSQCRSRYGDKFIEDDLRAALANWTEELTPRKRLTNDEIDSMIDEYVGITCREKHDFARAIEKRILEGV